MIGLMFCLILQIAAEQACGLLLDGESRVA